MLMLVDWDEHTIDFFSDDQLTEQLNGLKLIDYEGTRSLIQLDANFQQKDIAYNVDGELLAG